MNVTLIGMAGSGKSTIGLELANLLNFSFLDIDRLIEAKRSKSLQSVLDELGDTDFISLEAKTILQLNPSSTVLSPGGSIIYSDSAMKHLKEISKIVFIDVPLGEIKKRIKNIDTRGIVGLKIKTIDELFEERMPLYKRYADFTFVPSDDFDGVQTAQAIKVVLFR